jgi:hypothetical protein
VEIRKNFLNGFPNPLLGRNTEFIFKYPLTNRNRCWLSRNKNKGGEMLP